MMGENTQPQGDIIAGKRLFTLQVIDILEGRLSVNSHIIDPLRPGERGDVRESTVPRRSALKVNAL